MVRPCRRAHFLARHSRTFAIPASQLELALGAEGPADIDASTMGVFLRKCSWTGRTFATVWTESACVTFPTPSRCLEGANMCAGYKASPWPSFSHRATLDEDTSMDVWQRSRHGGNDDGGDGLGVGSDGGGCSGGDCARFPVSTLYTLKDSCMPVVMTQAVGPAARGGGGKHGVMSGLLELFGAAMPVDVLAAVKLQDAPTIEPTDLNWLQAVFSNATTERPNNGLFRAPERCRKSFPADANLV